MRLQTGDDRSRERPVVVVRGTRNVRPRRGPATAAGPRHHAQGGALVVYEVLDAANHGGEHPLEVSLAGRSYLLALSSCSALMFPFHSYVYVSELY